MFRSSARISKGREWLSVANTCVIAYMTVLVCGIKHGF